MKTTRSPEADLSAEISPATAIGLTILAVIAAGFVRLLLDPILGDDTPYPTFFAAVVFASRIGGWRTAALATVLGFFIAWFLFVPPRLTVLSNYASQPVGLGLYLLVCLLVAVVGESMQRSTAATRDAQKRLGRQAELARITLASIADGVITMDAAGKVTFLNDVAQRLTGWTQDRAEQRTLDEIFCLVDQETRKPVQNLVLRAISSGSARSLAARALLISKDGTEWPIEDSTSPILDEHHRIQGAVVIFRDVRSRQQTDVAEKQAAEQSRVILDSITDAFFAVDRNWRFAYINRSAESLIDRPRDELLGQVMWHAYPGVVGTEFEPAFRQAMNQRTPAAVTAYYADHDRWYQLRVYPSDDGISIYLQDVSEQQRAAAENLRLMNVSEQLRRIYETALSNTPDFNYIFDLHGRFIYINKSLLALWGKTFSESVNKNFYELDYPPELAARLQRQIQQVIESKQPLRDETPYANADGERQYEYIFMPVLAENGTVEAVAGSTRDVTDRKQAETMLREADRRKDEFLAILAHELRNPLAPIRNGLEILRLSHGDEASREATREMMDRQLTHVVRLVDDLMDVSRISQGKFELHRERVALLTIIQSAIETSRPLIEHLEHTVTLSLPETPVIVDADPIRLAQAISNLLNNAAKYSDRGGKISLTARVANSEVLLSVQDSGVGLSPDEISRVFVMFSQTESSLAKSRGGLGIGLTLVRKMIEMHGGTVEAHSDGPGKGSTFTIRLPWQPTAAEADIKDGMPASNCDVPVFRILVVDDNRDGADSLTMMLRIMGNETRTAYDGKQGLDMAAEFQPDIALLDIGLPGLNGYEVARHIRNQPWGRNTILIAVTGWGQEEDRRRSTEAGFNQHLVKPVDPHFLMKMLSQAGHCHA